MTHRLLHRKMQGAIRGQSSPSKLSKAKKHWLPAAVATAAMTERICRKLDRKNKNSVVTIQLHVNERGKLLSSRALSEDPRGYNRGAFEIDMMSTAEFVPGFRNGKACDCSLQMTQDIESEHHIGQAAH